MGSKTNKEIQEGETTIVPAGLPRRSSQWGVPPPISGSRSCQRLDPPYPSCAPPRVHDRAAWIETASRTASVQLLQSVKRVSVSSVDIVRQTGVPSGLGSESGGKSRGVDALRERRPFAATKLAEEAAVLMMSVCSHSAPPSSA